MGRTGGEGNVVLRGSGAQGSDNGGSTIRVHDAINSVYSGLFQTARQGTGGRAQPIIGSFPRGSTFFDVAGQQFIYEQRFS